MTSECEVDEFYNFIYPLAIKAGEILLEGYTGQKNVKKKGVFYDMVTDYDTKIEDFLMNEIAKIYPDHEFIGEEESALKNITKVLTNKPTWIIDPIDGTSNFVKQLPHACVSIALAINREVVIGIVVNPILKEVYTTKKGHGAFMNGERIRVSDCEKINDAVLGYEVSLFHKASVRQKHVKRAYYLGSNATRLLSYSSVVLALCYVARGSLDGYHIEDMFPWDVAAGQLLIQEAGGIVLHTSGNPLDVMKPDLICAGTENLHKEMYDIIMEADSKKWKFE